MAVRQFYRVAAAATGWFALVLQYYLTTHKPGAEWLPATISYFGYFTILTNMLVALALTLPWLAPKSWAGRFFDRASVRTAIATYIVIVALIYHLVLRHLWDPQGWQKLADVIEHYVMPALYLIDWFAFVPKGTLAFRSLFVWLGFPVAYALYGLIRGAFSATYPYPFLNVAELGYDKVLLNMAGLVAMFLVVGLGFIAIDRFLSGRQQVHPGPR